MATTTNYGWTTPDDTALVKDGAAAIRTLGSSVDTTTKNLNPETTLGDIAYRSSTANVKTRLGLGTAGQVLAVNSGATAPQWITPAGGGLTLISEYVANAESSIVFSSISQSYKQLLMIWSGIRHSAASNSFGLRFNNDSGTNYYMSGGNGLNTTAAYDVHTASHACGATSGIKLPAFGINANNTALEKDVKGMLLLDNYASTTKGKSFQLNNGFFIAADSQSVGTNTSGYYDSASAITSLDIVRLAGAGTISNATLTTIRLYGVS